MTRLFLLTGKALTKEDMRKAYGEPSYELPIFGSIMSPGSDVMAPQTVVSGPCFIYDTLAETDDVRVEVDRYGKLKFSFTGK